MSKHNGQQRKETRHRIDHLEEQLVKFKDVMPKLIRANNAASMLLGCMERFLDKKYPGWDDGVRQQVQQQAENARELDRIKQTLLAEREGKIDPLTSEQLTELGQKLWGLAGRMGIEPLVGCDAVAILLKANNVEGAQRILRQLKDQDGNPIEGLTEHGIKMLGVLETRCEEIRKEVQV